MSVEEIQRDLPGYLHRVELGEIITVTQAVHPIAEIKPVTADTKQIRPFGLCAGEFVVPDDFYDPRPDKILKGFTARIQGGVTEHE